MSRHYSQAAPLWWEKLRRWWLIYHLGEPEFAPMFDPPPHDEWVALDCETTGLNTRSDEIISVGAVRIVGDRIMTSERLELLIRPEKGVSADSVRIHRLRERDLEGGLPKDEAMRRLMRFIGSRPLVGYYLEFDVAMLNRAIVPILGLGLPQHRWRVSHVDASGQRRITTVTAASSWLALNWVEQLYGVPRACAAIRLTPETPTH